MIQCISLYSKPTTYDCCELSKMQTRVRMCNRVKLGTHIQPSWLNKKKADRLPYQHKQCWFSNLPCCAFAFWRGLPPLEHTNRACSHCLQALIFVGFANNLALQTHSWNRNHLYVGVLAWVHTCHGSQKGVRYAPVHRFRCESFPNFCLNSHLIWSQRHTGPFFRGCPGGVLTGTIESRSQSPVMWIRCRVKFQLA